MVQPAKSRSARHPKRDRVVAAASKLFLAHGYEAAGMDAIAEVAGVSKATVYSYYGDKATLFADVMAKTCEELGGPLPVEDLAFASPDEALRALALHGLRKVMETVQRQILPRVVAESRDFPELGRKFWENGPGKFEVAVARYLAEAKRQKRLDIADPARAAARLVGQITGLYLLPLLIGVRGRPSEAEIRRDVDLLIAGFLATARPRK